MTVTVHPDGSVQYAEPYFVTPHAMRRYRERIRAGVSDEEIIRRVNLGLQGEGPSDRGWHPPDRPIALGVRARKAIGPGFIAIVAPPSEGHGPWPGVVTIWGWDLCPILLRRKGGPNVGWRFYRWLKRDGHGDGGMGLT